MRIQTLIVKGIIAGACLFIPTEVLANDHGKPDELPKPPVNLEDGKEKRTSDAANENGNNDQQKGKPAGKHKPELPAQSKASVNVDHSDESSKSGERGNSVHANVNAKNKSVDGKTVSDAKKDTNKPSVEAREPEKTVHSNREKNSVKDKASSSEKRSMDVEKKRSKQKLDKRITSKASKKRTNSAINVKDSEKSNHNQQPLPHDESPANSPIVIPSQTVNPLSKSTNQDSQPNKSGNGFHLYGLSFIGIGPLVTIGRDFLAEHRREHNQWTNAPPSPPPKSNLLPHSFK